MSDYLHENPAEFQAFLADLERRSTKAVEDMHVAIERIKTQAARERKVQRVLEAEALEAEAREAEEEAARFDVRDVEELQVWSEQFGYRHGYHNRPLRFSAFHEIMRREWAAHYLDLDPRYYESYYVGGHMRGENDALAQGAYAIEHGESRAPNAPVLRQKYR